MLTLSAISLSLSLMMGAPAPAPAPAPMEADSMPAVQCEEDMPCWDADSMGNGLSDTLQADAWATLDASNITFEQATEDLMLSYSETVSGRPASLPVGSFVVESNTSPNAFHVFKWDRLYFA